MLRSGKRWLVATVLSTFLLCTAAPAAYAVDWGQTLLGAGVYYVTMKNQLAYYNGEGSPKLYEQLRKENGVDNDPAKNELLARIMTRLTQTVAKTEKIDPPYRYFVNTHKDFNAFCALGHNVSVNTGLFDSLQNDEDEIAFVLAHEMVHGQKNHSLNSLDKIMPINIVQSVLAQQGTGNAILGVVAGNYLIAKQATLPGEWEADNVGFGYAVNAGYNPGAGAAIWAKILEKQGDNHRNFLGEVVSPNDHPTNSQRVANYSQKLTEYSKGHVSYQPKTQMIIVNNQPWFKVGASSNKTAHERGFLIAGRLAKLFHDDAVSANATTLDNVVLLGDVEIVTANAHDTDAETAAAKLNDILNQ